ncbi:MAG: hypothetical protein RMX68_015575 [Aulosira sp. ZfuVER01]|nr:hypothetical protein [Aulosira sp. ZfuVER01]MDZ7997147.1 hypothetical protein [Aulosira sp. DedVER01a]MDZ8052769.1 hypothetical protein [Aulosira sp. ZfuCHP01]
MKHFTSLVLGTLIAATATLAFALPAKADFVQYHRPSDRYNQVDRNRPEYNYRVNHPRRELRFRINHPNRTFQPPLIRRSDRWSDRIRERPIHYRIHHRFD